MTALLGEDKQLADPPWEARACWVGRCSGHRAEAGREAVLGAWG